MSLLKVSNNFIQLMGSVQKRFSSLFKISFCTTDVNEGEVPWHVQVNFFQKRNKLLVTKENKFQMFSSKGSIWLLKVEGILPGPNLDLVCIQQLNPAPFCKNYAKLYFDAKTPRKGIEQGW